MSTTADLVARLEAILPQTQCRQCGYDGCRPYAQALAENRAASDRCPPGGDAGARQLAAALDRPYRPVDIACGPPKQAATRLIIEEDICIGCTKCIQACPVDAIVGANQLMHTVIAAECTGCELCIPVCPVDCIRVVDAGHTGADYRAHLQAQRATAYRRHHARNARLQRLREEQLQARAQRRAQIPSAPIAATEGPAAAVADDPVARALAAARARRAQARGTPSS